MENLASDIIRGLIKVIIALIITNIITVIGFLVYLSIPAEETQETVSQQAQDEGLNSYIGGNLNVETGHTEANN